MNTPAITRDIQYHPAIGDQARSINVLHIICSLPVGGAENQVVTLASALHKENHEVHVCCLRREGAQAATLQGRGIPVFALHMRKRYLPIGLYRLYRLMKRVKPQIVHTHLGEADLWGKLVGRLAGVPVILSTLHGMPPQNQRYQWFIERFANRYADKIIAVSEEIRQCYLANRAAPPEKIITIPTTVDTDKFRAVDSRNQTRRQLGVEPSCPLIGVVARLVPEKRLDIFLEAAQKIREVVPSARFLIIGDGILRKELHDRAAQLGLVPDCVAFLGSRQDIPDLLSALDIFVLSSETEGLPVSMLEAMAASRPMVVTRVGAIPQVIQDGCNGLLVSPHDPHALAKAVLRILEDGVLRESVSREACRTVEAGFSTTVVTRRIVALYNALLEKRQGNLVS